MTSSKRCRFVILYAFLLSTSGACASKSVDSLKLIMTPLESSLPAGLVVIESSLLSSLKKTVRILPWNTPLDSSVNGRFLRVLDVSSGDAKELPYVGRMVKRAAPEANDYLDLSPSKPLSNRLDITNSYNFCRNRQYIIEFAGTFFAPDGEAYIVESKSVEFTSSDEFPQCK